MEFEGDPNSHIKTGWTPTEAEIGDGFIIEMDVWFDSSNSGGNNYMGGFSPSRFYFGRDYLGRGFIWFNDFSRDSGDNITIPTEKWINYKIIFNRPNIQWFVDDQLIGSSTNSNEFTSSSELYIGAINNMAETFKGKMRTFKFSTLDGVAILNFVMEEEGETGKIISKNPLYEGVMSNVTEIEDILPTNDKKFFKPKKDGVAYFNGLRHDETSDISIETPTSHNMDWTYSFHVKYEGLNYISHNTLLVGDDAGNSVLAFYVDTTFGSANRQMRLFYGSQGEVFIGPDIREAGWTWVTLTKEGATCKLYINGVEEKSETLTGTVDSSDGFVIGSQSPTTELRPTEIEMKQFLFYDRALTSAEINDMIKDNPSTTGLKTFIDFRTGAIEDLSGNDTISEIRNVKVFDGYIDGDEGTQTLAPTPELSMAHTVMFWIYIPSDYSEDFSIFYHQASPLSSHEGRLIIGLIKSIDMIRLTTKIGAAWRRNFDFSDYYDKWVHMSVGVTSTRSFENICINGQLVSLINPATGWGGSYTDTDFMILNGRVLSNVNTRNTNSFKIADLKVFDKILSVSEIQDEIYTDTNTTDKILHYKLGTTINDKQPEIVDGWDGYSSKNKNVHNKTYRKFKKGVMNGNEVL